MQEEGPLRLLLCLETHFFFAGGWFRAVRGDPVWDIGCDGGAVPHGKRMQLSWDRLSWCALLTHSCGLVTAILQCVFLSRKSSGAQVRSRILMSDFIQPPMVSPTRINVSDIIVAVCCLARTSG